MEQKKQDENMEQKNQENKEPEQIKIAPATIQHAAPVTAGFDTAEGFGLLQRMAKMFSYSSLVPDAYQTKYDKDGNPTLTGMSNCIIALNMAQRMHADPLMVIQNLYIVHNQPAWSSKFLIATFNQCGRYTSIHYKEVGEKGTDTQGVQAWAVEKATGETLMGPIVTIAIAKAEGWYGKSGSKWKTMADQMLRYRAAAWFIRTTAPELSMGLQTVDEVYDVRGDREAQSVYERTVIDSQEIIDAEITADTSKNAEDAPQQPQMNLGI